MGGCGMTEVSDVQLLKELSHWNISLWDSSTGGRGYIVDIKPNQSNYK